jgi:hypothetical protein
MYSTGEMIFNLGSCIIAIFVFYILIFWVADKATKIRLNRINKQRLKKFNEEDNALNDTK